MSAETAGPVAGEVAGPALVITVHGVPAPQGSKRHVGRGIMVESSAKVKPWREAVKWAILHEFPEPHAPFVGAVGVDVTFILPRPKHHFRTGANAHLLRDAAPPWPAGKPDLDKLLRSTLDAITDSGVIGDDAQVVFITARKLYLSAVRHVGAVIRIVAVGA